MEEGESWRGEEREAGRDGKGRDGTVRKRAKQKEESEEREGRGKKKETRKKRENRNYGDRRLSRTDRPRSMDEHEYTSKINE